MVSIEIILQAQGLKFRLFSGIDIKAEFFIASDEGRLRTRLHSAAPFGSIYGLHMFAARKVLATVHALSVPAEEREKTSEPRAPYRVEYGV